MSKFLNLIQYVDDGTQWNADTNPNNDDSDLRTIKLSQHNDPGTTIMRDSNGRAQISDPRDDLDIANKKYADVVSKDILILTQQQVDSLF